MEITLNMAGLDATTRNWIEEEARRSGTSVQSVIERLIQRAVTAERQESPAQRFRDLDDLAGTWTAEEADSFRAATADFEQIDTALWR